MVWIIIASRCGKCEKRGSASSDLYSQSAHLFKTESRACENGREILEQTETTLGKAMTVTCSPFQPRSSPFPYHKKTSVGLKLSPVAGGRLDRQVWGKPLLGNILYYCSSLLEQRRPQTLIERELQPHKVHIHQEGRHRRILTADVVSSL
jgi:hypothetical protein